MAAGNGLYSFLRQNSYKKCLFMLCLTGGKVDTLYTPCSMNHCESKH